MAARGGYCSVAHLQPSCYMYRRLPRAGFSEIPRRGAWGGWRADPGRCWARDTWGAGERDEDCRAPAGRSGRFLDPAKALDHAKRVAVVAARRDGQFVHEAAHEEHPPAADPQFG